MKPRQAPETEGRVGAPETAAKPRLFAVKAEQKTPLYLATSRMALAKALGIGIHEVDENPVDPKAIDDELIASAIVMAEEDRMGRDAVLVWENYELQAA